jgi:hypothetical protein
VPLVGHGSAKKLEDSDRSNSVKSASPVDQAIKLGPQRLFLQSLWHRVQSICLHQPAEIDQLAAAQRGGSSQMTEPSGKIVARPMVVRACGHQQEFQHYAVDKYRAQRLAKFQKTRCADCAAKLVEEQQRAAEAVPKRGEALQSLPPGTQVSLTRQPDGSWAGTLAAAGKSVQTAGIAGAGPQSVVVALARLWVAASGAEPQ